MKVIFEFLPTDNGAMKMVAVDADLVEQKNGWLIASKSDFMVFGAKENCVKYFWLYEE